MVIYKCKAISLLLLSREPGSASPALTILSQCYNPSVNISRLTYRSRQFWNALLSPGKRVTSEALLLHLTSAQFILFRRMQPAEQLHAYQIFKRLQVSGQATPELLTAALLHDVGKILVPLSIFDRVVIVLGKHLFRRAALRWAEGTPHGWRLPFVVAEHHAGWGADLASQAGAPALAVELIRRHHDGPGQNLDPDTEHLLAALQAADNES
jgi:HD domain